MHSIRRGRTPASLMVILLSLFGGSAALASGSVAVAVASSRHELTVAQTFRRILRPGTARKYKQSVTNRFLDLLAPRTKAIDRLLQRRAKPLSLGRFDLSLPIVRCAAKACPPLKKARFPALVELASIQSGGSALLAYTVKIAFARRPGVKQLVVVRGEIERALGAAARSPGKLDRAVKLSPLEDLQKDYRLTLQPKDLWVSPPEKKRLQGQLTSMARRVRRRLHGKLGSRAGGVGLAAYDDRLAFHGHTKRLPARIIVQADAPYFQALVYIALGRIQDRPALTAYTQGIERRLSQILRPRVP